MFFGTARAPVVCHPARSSSRTAWAPLATVRPISFEVTLHGIRIGKGHGERRPRTASRTDRTEQVGALVALVGGLARPGSAPRPLPHKAILLADPGLVLEPDLDGLSRCEVTQMGSQCAGEIFLKASIVRS